MSSHLCISFDPCPACGVTATARVEQARQMRRRNLSNVQPLRGGEFEAAIASSPARRLMSRLPPAHVPTAEPYRRTATTSPARARPVVLVVLTGFLVGVVFAAAPCLLVLLREPGCCGRLSGAFLQGKRLNRVDELLAPVHENDFYLPIRLVAVSDEGQAAFRLPLHSRFSDVPPGWNTGYMYSIWIG